MWINIWFNLSLFWLDCTMAYTLLSRIPDGVNPLLEIFERYITNIGNGLIIRMGNSIAKVYFIYLKWTTYTF